MTTEVLGPEHDPRLARATAWALRKAGARRLDHKWSLFGSQEVIEQCWLSSTGPLTLTAETYIGLVLDGPEEVVDQVKSLIARRLG
ncbi:hypothetical protein [Brevundimonas sp. FT23028]|uniref:hypothetical protein n=1 Tax=Brevundimonas sp. FT23028 TaxID=3393748 RepID=UPI003B58703E